MKGQSEFVTSYMGFWWAGDWEGPGSKPCAISPNFSTSVQSKVYSYPAGMTMTFYTKITLHTATTLPLVTIICFEIWNLIATVSAIRDDEWLKPLSLTLEIGSI